MPPAGSSYDYDLFIAHAAADHYWVAGYLTDALHAAGISYHSAAAFDLGAFAITSYEEAIRRSERVLLVISASYGAERYDTVVRVMAQEQAVDTDPRRVITLLLDEIDLPPQLQAQVRLDATTQAKWASAVERLCLELRRAPPAAASRPPCPYPVRAYTQDEAHIFFGRGAEIRRMLQHLVDQRLLCLIGPSGSGKSSLVFAGLLPALRQSSLFPPDSWLVVTMRPGADPVHELLTRLGGGANDVATTVGSMLAAVPTARRLLLVVDQLEEAWTMAPAQACTEFVRLLCVLRDVEQCSLVFTIREDIFWDELPSSALGPISERQQMEIAPLEDRALETAITGPARTVQVFVEPRLVEALVQDAADEPGVLPLLQETMRLLWDDMQRRLLTRESYERLGEDGRTGLEVALKRKADATLEALTPRQQELARQVFLRLIQFSEGRPPTRRQQSLGKLETGAKAEIEAVVRTFERARMLTFSADPALPGKIAELERASVRVDLAHEALIEGWDTLQQWIAQGRADEETRRGLQQAADEWYAHAPDRSYLLTRTRMRNAQIWVAAHPDQVGDDVREYLRLSAHYDRRQRQARLATIAVAACLLLGLLGYRPAQAMYRQTLRSEAERLNSWVLLPGGTMISGTRDPEPFDGEHPEHRVTVPDFWIQQHEVTNAEFALCVRAAACLPGKIEPQSLTDPARGRLPVQNVDARQAHAYCHWLAAHLPTTIEWERAARGRRGDPWPWGADEPSALLANVSTPDKPAVEVAPVNSYPAGASIEGVVDLVGNVAEWTSTTFPCPDDSCPWNPEAPGEVALYMLGGDWTNEITRITEPFPAGPDFGEEMFGFRCSR